MKKLLIILSLTLMTAVLFAGDVKIIVNKENSLSALTKAEVSQFFLKKKTKWNAGKVKPVDQKNKSSVRKKFSKNFLGKKVSAIKKYWMEQMFAGNNNPPKIKSSDTSVIEYVKSNKGAIGYISSETPSDGVKVIKVK